MGFQKGERVLSFWSMVQESDIILVQVQAAYVLMHGFQRQCLLGRFAHLPNDAFSDFSGSVPEVAEQSS